LCSSRSRHGARALLLPRVAGRRDGR
jgi:hypothetical protein